jgi:hypothetical protein
MAWDGMYAVQRPMRSLTRTDVMRGPILFHRPPCRSPRPLTAFVSPCGPGPSSTTSEVRLQRHFASICTFRDCARDVSRVDFGRRNDAKDQTSAGSITQRAKRLHSFLP